MAVTETTIRSEITDLIRTGGQCRHPATLLNLQNGAESA